MEQGEVENHIIKILQSIQSDSGHDTGNINSQTHPFVDLEGFDSYLEVDAISMLAMELPVGVNIPNDRHIFVSEDCKRLLSIQDSATLVCEIVSSGVSQT
ncbi:MAG: hypothetical protein AAGJ08_09210 [Cyanobacteria bacterium P01_H01_bin.35]